MPRYFNKYPKVFYNNKLLTDIIARVKFLDNVIDNPALYYNYTWQESDTPEIVAHKYYKDSELHWIILLTNRIFDSTFDFPMKSDVFAKYVNRKYLLQAFSSVRFFDIMNFGQGYLNGVYEDIPLKIANPNELEYLGKNIETRIYAHNGQIQKIDVTRGGVNYHPGTIFTVDNSLIGGSGADFYCSIAEFLASNPQNLPFAGAEYAKLNIDEDFGYQKIVRITENATGQVLSEQYYVIDKEQYSTLYYEDPYKYVVDDLYGSSLTYETIRRFPVTYFEREEDVNEKKRVVKILKEEFAPLVRKQLGSLLTRVVM